MVRRTVPILVRITRSSVDGRPIRTTCGTDQQVIRTGVDGALDPVCTRTDPKWYGSISDPYQFLLAFTLDRIQIHMKLIQQ